MGCIMSRPTKLAGENQCQPLAVGAQWSVGDSCDYATSRARQEPHAANINQAQAAGMLTASSSEQMIDLGHSNRHEPATGRSSDKRRDTSVMERRTSNMRKRQRQTDACEQTSSGGGGGGGVSFLSFMFMPGRRHSAVRIEAAPSSPADSDRLTEQSGHLRVTKAAGVSGEKRKLNHSSAHSGGISDPIMEQVGDKQETSVDQSAPKSQTESGNEDGDVGGTSESSHGDEVLLFTSVQQLCYEIINRKLCVRDLCHGVRSAGESDHFHRRSDLLCLFVFGRSGSSKGELSFDLVDHSSLVDVLMNRERLKQLATECNQEREQRCPLFHYLDVSALIVANIDGRIREYNRLVARTLRDRRHRLALVATRQESEELDAEENSATRGGQSDGESHQSAATLEQERGSSFDSQQQEADAATIMSGTNEPADGETNGKQPDVCKRRASLEQQFGIMTLSTKQRSILQLKLMKYATCVTSKWIIIMIKQEINKLERRLKQLMGTVDAGTPVQLARLPKRIYLINLIPNQLTLFKSCLYLEQELSLADFRQPYYAIQFERRTNIRVLRKERSVERRAEAFGTKREGGVNRPDSARSFQFKLAHIKIPILLPLGKSVSHESLVMASQPLETPALVSLSSETLRSSVNEKLGPKFNDNFARQFKNCERLIQVRYNPLKFAPITRTEGMHKFCYSRFHSIEKEIDQPASGPAASPSRWSCGSFTQLQPPSPLAASPGLSVSSERLNLLPGDERASLSSSSSMIDLHRPIGGELAYTLCAPSTSTSSQSHAPKWAIELELVYADEERRHSGGARDSAVDEKLNQRFELHVYQAPRAGSRSRLMLAASDRYQHLVHSNGQHGYALTPVQVAYANGASQTILEVRRVHRRAIRFKSAADLAKLDKMVAHARRQLLDDLGSWLASAILSEPHGQQHQARGLRPALVTHTIRIDLSQFKWEACGAPAANSNHLAPPVAVLTTRPASAVDRLRPVLKVRPASSISNEETASANEQLAARRHVQFSFCIEQAPEQNENAAAQLGPPQRRVWLDEFLFASCCEPQLIDSMNSFVKLLQKQQQQQQQAHK